MSTKEHRFSPLALGVEAIDRLLRTKFYLERDNFQELEWCKTLLNRYSALNPPSEKASDKSL